jgi:hypothetical protein
MNKNILIYLIPMFLIIIGVVLIEFLPDHINYEPTVNIIGRHDGGKIILKLESKTTIKFNDIYIGVTINGNTSEITDYDIVKYNEDNIRDEGEIIFFHIENVTTLNNFSL